MPTTAAPILLRIRGLCKSYAAPVLRDIDADISAGQVHALIGANGAGKSTLAKIISGLVQPDRGTMHLGGAAYAPRRKADAEACGVHIVQQELNLIGTLSIAENLLLNRLPHRFGVIDARKMRRQAYRALRLVGLEDWDADTPVSRLGVGQQQLVEIASALSRHCRLLVLDEPTSALTAPQAELLFDHIRRLRAAGVGILYVSHRMEELRRIADQATVLRDGRIVCTAEMSQLAPGEIVRLLTGKEVRGPGPRQARRGGPVQLRVRVLRRGSSVRGVSFEVRGGEIFGIAGLVGSGRTELLQTLFGSEQADSGSVEIAGRSRSHPFRSPRQAAAAGLAMIPEDRRQHGLLLSQPVTMNVTLGSLARLSSPLGCVDARAERRVARQYCQRMQVQCHSLEQRTDQLSGGNQQKLMIARWLLRDAAVYLFDEPTRGVDVGAKATIHELLAELADRGKAVVVVSSELPELLALCDRIGVMSAGRLVAVFERGQWSAERILHAALSGRAE